MGRPTQGVKVMNIKDDDRVSAVALVVDSGPVRGARRRSRPASRARARGLGGDGQVLLPGRGDRGLATWMKTVAPAPWARFAGASGSLAAAGLLAAVAGSAGGDDVLPDGFSTAAPGNHVIDSQPGLAGAAVLASPSVARQHRSPSDLPPVRFPGNRTSLTSLITSGASIVIRSDWSSPFCRSNSSAFSLRSSTAARRTCKR